VEIREEAGAENFFLFGLTTEEVAATKKELGLDPEKSFDVPADVLKHAREAVTRGAQLKAKWNAEFSQWEKSNADQAKLLKRLRDRELPADWEKVLPTFESGKDIATRAASGKIINAIATVLPEFWGGSSDLAGSNNTTITGGGSFLPTSSKMKDANPYGRIVHFGIREHAMGAIINGIALHGLTRSFGGTFLVFSDYMRGAVRLAALMNIPSIFVWTHDSIGLGEDGPTHQPVEHIASLRAIPGLVVIRPSDANETSEAWRVISEELDGPVALILSRQDLPVLDRSKYASASKLVEGAYVLACNGNPAAVIVATGSEVGLAIDAREQLAAAGVEVRVVAMPSWELFEPRSAGDRAEVLPAGLPTVSVEAGISMGWERYAQAHVAVNRFGASAPGDELMERFGITPAAVVAEVQALLGA
jgi:transketolase